MKEYFYSDGIEQKGPVSFDELKKIGITQDTLIWFEEMSDWDRASNIPEFKEILNDKNQQDSDISDYKTIETRKRNKKQIKILRICGGIIIILLIVAFLPIYPCINYGTDYVYYDYDYSRNDYRASGNHFDVYPELRVSITVYNEENRGGTFKVYAKYYGEDQGYFHLNDSEYISANSSYTFKFTRTLEHYEYFEFEDIEITPPTKSSTYEYETEGNFFEFLSDL